MRSRSTPVHRSRGSLLAAVRPALASAVVAFVAPALADSTAEHDLVVLAEPQVTTALAAGDARRDVVVDYRIVEVFRGEPDSTRLAVLHRMLDAEQRALLAGTPRVIVLASEEGDARWAGPLPLRATPAAVDAFRSWSAPPDVRPPRAVDEVIAEVASDVTFASPGELPPPAPPLADEGSRSSESVVLADHDHDIDVGIDNDIDADTDTDVDAAPQATRREVASRDETTRSVPPDVVESDRSGPASPSPGSSKDVASSESASDRVATTRVATDVRPIDRLQRPGALPPASSSERVVSARPTWGGGDDGAEPMTSSTSSTSPPMPSAILPARQPIDRLERSGDHGGLARDDSPAPPLLYDPILVPAEGIPLPPEPPAEPLGPVASERRDLRRPGDERRPSIAHARELRDAGRDGAGDVARDRERNAATKKAAAR